MNLKLYITLLFVGAICFCGCKSTLLDNDTSQLKAVLAGLEEVDDVCSKMSDINFKSYCYDNFDVNHDSKVSMVEAEAVTAISCSTAMDFAGIEYFSNLTSIASTSVETVDLRYNTELTSIEFSGSPIKQIDLSYNQNLTALTDEAFRECTNLTSVVLPSNLTSIGIYAFLGCTELSSLPFPSSLVSIGERAFLRCTSLSPITLPEGLTSIGAYGLSGCSSLTSITLPESLTSMGSYILYGCTNLTSVNLPSNMTFLGYGFFSKCTSLASIDLPSGLTSIAGDAFYGCASLTTIDLPATLTSIGAYAFSGCNSLNTVLSNAITPPTFYSSTFPTNESAILYVPAESMEAYMNSDWAKYFNQILSL